MVKRPKIHAPKIPAGEDAAVTIGNLQNQVKLLLDRVEELRGERDDFERKFYSQFEMTNSLADQVGKLQAVHERMAGWRDCAREIIGSIELPLSTKS